MNTIHKYSFLSGFALKGININIALEEVYKVNLYNPLYILFAVVIIKRFKEIKMLKLQITYKSEAELMDFILMLKMRRSDFKVKPSENEESRTTRGGYKIRCIDIKHL